MQHHHSHKKSQSSRELQPKQATSITQNQFFKDMSQILTSKASSKRRTGFLPHLRLTTFLLNNRETPFDDSIYDSNRRHQSSKHTSKNERSSRETRKTQKKQNK